MNEVIFVFGSNRQGRHGKGAALHACQHYGAVYGEPTGLQGNAYAIVTKELRLDRPPVTLHEISVGVANFLSFARVHPEFSFHVTPIGCGLAGFSAHDIAPMFDGAPDNVTLPPQFINL